MKHLAGKYVKMMLKPKLDKLGLVYLEPEYIYYKLGKVYEQEGLLKTVFKDGKLIKSTTMAQIRERLKGV